MFTELPVEKLRDRAPRAYTMKEAERLIAGAMQELETLAAQDAGPMLTPEAQRTAQDTAAGTRTGDAAASQNHRAKAQQQETAKLTRLLEYLAILDRDPAQHAKAQQLMAAAFTHYEEDMLSRKVAEELYGGRILGSITRLERYSQCAYQHFLRYGLKLQERESFDLQMYDIGNLYHGAIEQSFRRTLEAEKKLETLSEEELGTLA